MSDDPVKRAFLAGYRCAEEDERRADYGNPRPGAEAHWREHLIEHSRFEGEATAMIEWLKATAESEDLPDLAWAALHIEQGAHLAKVGE